MLLDAFCICLFMFTACISSWLGVSGIMMRYCYISFQKFHFAFPT